MKIRQLEAFRALVECGTVTRAAEDLCVSQPAVTRLISDLEDSAGFALFERSKGRLHLTSEGMALYEEVERSLIGVQRIAATAESIRAGHLGMLKIASLPALGLSCLPRAIGEFLKERPQIQISLNCIPSRAVVDMVAKERCDVGFAIVQMNYPSQYGELLISNDLVCALPEGHRLAAKKLIVPTDLEGEHFISNTRELSSRLEVDAVFTSFGVDRRMQLETQINASVCAFVQAGMGIALVDTFSALEYVGRGVVFRRFEPALHNEIQVLYGTGRAPSALLRAFVEHLRARLNARLAQELYSTM
ncbi:LysR family transcriptional regulator [Oxalobacteraceae bacterium OM1]|nr:LysR family transcriptional regulator [Oxalobacteraceae bacterium OM1]